MGNRTIRYSEIFYSLQGEGVYTGVPSTFIRLWGCNLHCDGFLQPDPTNPSTYIDIVRDPDLTYVNDIKELPPFKRGCDSAYSWNKHYRKLVKEGTAKEIIDLVLNELNTHSGACYPPHLVFTGGEPMLWQDQLVELMRKWQNHVGAYDSITIETNGTKPIKESLYGYASRPKTSNILWSVSPKLYNVSGEEKGFNPGAIASYNEAMRGNDLGQLKFVMNNNDDSWEELGEALFELEKHHVYWPVWIMPVGVTNKPGDPDTVAIVEKALKYGYNVSMRTHSYIWGSEVGR
ncbi:MAG: 7-carboxy-7-deazaguanine synthase QueE [Candidatus Peribacteraceae bacterium]|nr:7-carboxy-7-deazaguanine synthase QueE [Candidatus Peribacteraceae bacterium]